MLAGKTSNSSSHKKQSGQTISYDKVWFSNDNLKQTLVFELYTDYHRLVTYHFYTETIPTELMNEISLHQSNGKLASKKQKQTDFSGFLKQSTQIDASCFVSNKGFRLGDIKQKAMSQYGKPDKQSVINGIEKL